MFIRNDAAKPNELIPLISMSVISVAWSTYSDKLSGLDQTASRLHIMLQSATQANALLESTCALTKFQRTILRKLLHTDNELIVYATGRASRISRKARV